MKICSKCKVEKKLEEFHQNGNSKDGFRKQCINCYNNAYINLYSKIIVKICSKCNISRDKKDFTKCTRNKDRLRSSCKICVKKHKEENKEYIALQNKIYYKRTKESHREKRNISSKKSREKNKEKSKKTNKIWRDSNKEYIHHYMANWRLQHIEECREYDRNMAKNMPAKFAAKTAKRRAAKFQATPKWLTTECFKEIEQIYIDCSDLQWLGDPLCNPLEVDHIVPFQGKNVSGLHVPWNMRIISRKENIAKGNRLK